MVTWEEHIQKWKDCQECNLCTQRTNMVFARGTVPCDVLFVGEAPGVSEDLLGLPFVGPAGKLQDQIVDRALSIVKCDYGLETITTMFTNLVCCFPREAKLTTNHQPENSEIMACRPRLEEFIKLCSPKLVVTVGTLAETYLSHNIGVRRTTQVHPSAILRMPLAQRDMAVRRTYVNLATAIGEAIV